MTDVIKEIEAKIQTYKGWRHDFHQHPELSFDENETARKIVHYLKEMGVDEVYQGLAKTGVIAIIRNGEGPGIALRADMDALPIHETTPHQYASCHSGVMHACGHDGHVVMLLAAAEYLCKHRNFQGSVVLIFQPAEEQIAGAALLLHEGLMEKFPFETIYTLHSWPGAPTNTMFVNVGPVMASVNNFKITIQSEGGHAAMPHLTPDPIVAGAEMVTALQSLASRKTDPQEPVVLSCTVFEGGSVYNVIPNQVTIKGTVRFVAPKLSEWIPEKMKQILDGIAHAHEVRVTLDYSPVCPPTYNTNNEALLAKSVIEELLGDSLRGKEKPISMGSDDFCFYLNEVPGAYVYIGNGEESKSLHHSKYDFNDEALPVGAGFYVRIVEETLKG